MAKKSGKSGHNSLVELVIIVVVALGLALGIQAFLVKPFRIPSESMVPTLEVGQRVLVDRVSFRFGDPDRGDIVVFKPPHGADLNSCGVLYNGAKQSLISCSVGVESLLPSNAFVMSSSETSPPKRHSINCWKFSPSSELPVGEVLSGTPPVVDGVSNVGCA